MYYNENLVTIHNISNKQINYHNNHHVDLLTITFKGQDKEAVSDYVNKDFKELEKFNGRLSEVM
ncbi:hypothetical protein K8O96_06705 [Clostridium sporogenes]|uniref:Uncharacterized protein n=1 Tax=Clostridium botulinum TaxID=1491 RepID=A0A6M0SVR8_CLOBO|nr:hypothetical protein [Clostridium sporogenes]NFA59576.1 hypothetical protein [Clostridium botulinum]NFI73410.1 hypothetical protein [Clostridium sporogenes]NFL71462.1 hypothetical protein [Clostridium sporogenes]NFM23269.1 hypothetical protein [Clostridium sporogenes]NFP61342.1 hypothetical protein [Clostridium sporogenes]